MDFFAAQAQARTASRRLVALFALAIAGTIGLIYLVLLPVFGEGGLWQPGLLLLTALGVGGTILIGSLIKIAALAAGGGAAVAESLGGRQILRSTTHSDEKRLLNLVDEMAIAAGIPAPQVYVLDDENAINAFAAGSEINEAVVAVTRGTLDTLSRDELQGVIAHEFSHILNGDMRLNLRLLGVLHGLFMLTSAGRILLRSGGRNSKDRSGLVLLGLALVVAGYIGVLAGRLIRAAVSRQREFLADAAAVQFTRNPHGITSALRRIASQGSPMAHPGSEEVSHMLFDSAQTTRWLSGWLATHPPLQERIQRLEGKRATAAQVAAPPPGKAARHLSEAAVGFSASIGNPTADALTDARELITALPPQHLTIARGDAPAASVVALLLASDPVLRARQGELLARHADAELGTQALALPPATPRQRLPLIELALPALRAQPLAERTAFIALVDHLVRADGRITLSEYIISRLLRDALLPRPPAPALAAPGELAAHCAVLLTVVAHAGSHADHAPQAFAQGAALAPADHLHLCPLHELRSDRIDQALAMLAATAPAYRQRLVGALAATAWHDGEIQPREAELLTLICGALGCPVPLPGHVAAAETTGEAEEAGATHALAAAAAPPADRLFADRLPLQALIVANLIPAFGVVFFDWDARSVLLLYWLENLVIGGYTLLRMLATHRWRAIGMLLFFCFHYGMFCGVHGMMLLGLTSIGPDSADDPMEDFWPEDEWPIFLMPIQMLTVIVQWMMAETPALLGLPLLAFLISHGISAFTHHAILREDDGRTAEKIMGDPYGRIVILHVALIAGSFPIILMGGGGAWPILMLVIAFKTGFDIHQHRKAHQRRQASRAMGLNDDNTQDQA